MAINGLFNLCENRLILNPRSIVWKAGMAVCNMLQVGFMLIPILLLVGGAIFLAAIYSGAF
jgi:hypothetical protein